MWRVMLCLTWPSGCQLGAAGQFTKGLSSKGRIKTISLGTSSKNASVVHEAIVYRSDLARKQQKVQCVAR